MARKKKHAEHVNHERWLVSYADFITLLFAFFVVMFAVSQVDSHKVGRFTEAFSKAVGIDVFPMQGASLLSGGKTPDETAGPTEQGLMPIIDDLKKTLTSLAKKQSLQGLQVIKLRNELVLRLPEGVFFDSGDARVKDSTSRMLKVLLPELKKRPVEVRIEGHTDNRPIMTGRFKSNWELSTARASAVMAIFLAEGMLPERTSIAGYAEYRPIADNASDEGRKQNRRVDLVVTALVIETPVPEEKDENKGEEATADSKDEAKGEAKAEAKDEAKGEAKADPAAEKAEAKAETKGEAKAEAKGETKGEAKGEAKADLKPDTEGEEKAETKAEGKNEAKVDTRGEAKAEPEGETKAEPKGAKAP